MSTMIQREGEEDCPTKKNYIYRKYTSQSTQKKIYNRKERDRARHGNGTKTFAFVRGKWNLL